jgi:hypothetical protein
MLSLAMEVFPEGVEQLFEASVTVAEMVWKSDLIKNRFEPGNAYLLHCIYRCFQRTAEEHMGTKTYEK